MTDTGSPAELDEVVVTGQRRGEPHQPFPERPQPVVWEGQYDELTPDMVERPDPCADPRSRRVWNADATAAAAAAALVAKAASLNDGSNLSNREFGTNLILGSNGRVEVQPNISVGGPAVGGQVPNVYIDMTGVTPTNWMGDIHNHPSGDGRLSAGEWTQFINYMSSLAATNPERSGELAYISVYVVVPDATSANGYRIYAYNRDTPYDTLGEEVNPNAQPCPNP